MTRNNPRRLSLCSHPSPWKTRAVWISLAAALLASCSLRNLDDLGSSDSAGGGVSDTGGAAGTGPKGGGPGSGGGSNPGGTTATGGVSGETSTSTGGVTTGTGGGEATSGAGGGAGTVKPSCPAYTGTGGALITPPSNDFEVDLASWTKANTSPSGVSLVTGDTTACQGSGYLRCDGEQRVGYWDGPAVDIQSYTVAGHTYALTAAVRFDPRNAPTNGLPIGMTSASWCDDTDKANYVPIHSTVTTTAWGRVKGQIKFPPVGCTKVNRLQIYFETDAAGEGTAFSIDVDDFRMIDITEAPIGTGGASGGGGASGTAGVAGNAGNAGNAGSGG